MTAPRGLSSRICAFRRLRTIFNLPNHPQPYSHILCILQNVLLVEAPSQVYGDYFVCGEEDSVVGVIPVVDAADNGEVVL